ncbi:MAG: Hsp20/alpha crystallin family protein [Burkholderiaceae bacterium]
MPAAPARRTPGYTVAQDEGHLRCGSTCQAVRGNSRSPSKVRKCRSKHRDCTAPGAPRLELPTPIDAAAESSARLEHGVLTLTWSARPPARAPWA